MTNYCGKLYIMDASNIRKFIPSTLSKKLPHEEKNYSHFHQMRCLLKHKKKKNNQINHRGLTKVIIFCYHLFVK